jgi:hypothetical protein
MPRTIHEWRDAAVREHAKWALIKASDVLPEKKTGKWRNNLEKQKVKRDPDAMEVDNTRLTPLTDEERKKLSQEGRCFRCRQQGHMSRDCPKKGQNARVNQTQATPKKDRVVDDRDDVSETGTDTTAVATPKKNVPESVIRAFKALTEEERDAVIESLLGQGPDF